MRIDHIAIARYVAVSIIAVALACSSSSGSGSVDGTVGGTSLSVSDAVVYSVTSSTAIAVVSTSGMCDYFDKGEFPKNITALVMYVSPPVTTPGTFQVGSPGAVEATWSVYDASCNATPTNATAGSVTLTAVTPARITGTFDLNFGTDHVSGSFSAASCAATADASAPSTCT